MFRPYHGWEAEPPTIDEEDTRNPWLGIRRVRQKRADDLYRRFLDALEKHGERSWMAKHRRYLWYKAWLKVRDAIRKYRYFQYKLEIADTGKEYVRNVPGKRWK